jgi:hypothetical protein
MVAHSACWTLGISNLILGSGPFNPITVYNVKVWQNSTANNISTVRRGNRLAAESGSECLDQLNTDGPHQGQ